MFFFFTVMPNLFYVDSMYLFHLYAANMDWKYTISI